MMRIALLSDIHGNLVALEAVLAELEREQVDRVVCLGDVAAVGAQPTETIARLRGTNWQFVMGNTDAWLLDPPPGLPDDPERRKLIETELWAASQLDAADRAFLAGFQPTVEVPLGAGGALLAYHGAPESFSIEILPGTPAEELDARFAGRSATVYAGGHSHDPMVRLHHDALLVNPGSVGWPFVTLPDGRLRHPYRAEWALLTVEEDGRCSITLRRTPVDQGRVQAAVMASGLPDPVWWLSRWGL